jgi:hypothetical protein
MIGISSGDSALGKCGTCVKDYKHQRVSDMRLVCRDYAISRLGAHPSGVTG